MSDLKTCPKCDVVKALDSFARDAYKRSGRKSHCRDCDNAKSRRYYEANRERVIARVTAYNAARGL